MMLTMLLKNIKNQITLVNAKINHFEVFSSSWFYKIIFSSILLSVEISNGCAEHKAAPSHVFVDRDIFG